MFKSSKSIDNFTTFQAIDTSTLNVYNPLVGFSVYGSDTTVPLFSINPVTNLSQFNTDVDVIGTITYRDIIITETTNPMIGLAKDQVADTYDIGLYGSYSGNTLYRGFFYDVTDNYWKIYTGNPTKPTTVVDSPDSYLSSLRVKNIQASDGKVSEPSIQFTSESNTGFYMSSTGNMSTAVSGSMKTTINANGLHINAGFYRNVRTESSGTDYTLLGTDDVLQLSTTNSIAVNLPACSSHSGKEYYIIKTGAAGTLSVTPNGADTIDGAVTPISLTTIYDRVRLTCDGVSNWYSG